MLLISLHIAKGRSTAFSVKNMAKKNVELFEQAIVLGQKSN